MVQDEKSAGFGAFDIFTLKDSNQAKEISTANASLLALDTWNYTLPDGSPNYTANVGILGLGPSCHSPNTTPPSILQSLKTQGNIGSLSFGLHIGSVAFSQLGSLILGGYERNRALGIPGQFTSQPDNNIRIQVGPSPFPNREGTIFPSLESNERANDITKNTGGKSNTATVIPNPAVPYIYLPPRHMRGGSGPPPRHLECQIDTLHVEHGRPSLRAHRPLPGAHSLRLHRPHGDKYHNKSPI